MLDFSLSPSTIYLYAGSEHVNSIAFNLMIDLYCSLGLLNYKKN